MPQAHHFVALMFQFDDVWRLAKAIDAVPRIDFANCPERAIFRRADL